MKRGWNTWAQRHVNASVIVMAYPPIENVLQMPLSQGDEEIHALPADGSDHTFGSGICLGRPERRPQYAHAVWPKYSCGTSVVFKQYSKTVMAFDRAALRVYQFAMNISSGQFEEHIDELNVTPNIVPVHPPSLPLPDHVYSLVTLNGSPSRLEFSKALPGVHSPFDRAVILLQDIIQVLHGSVPTTGARNSFLLYVGDGRPVDRR